jgi:hypothetical protein
MEIGPGSTIKGEFRKERLSVVTHGKRIPNVPLNELITMNLLLKPVTSIPLHN